MHIQECGYVRMLVEVTGNFSGSFKVCERFLLARNLSLSLLHYMSYTWVSPSLPRGFSSSFSALKHRQSSRMPLIKLFMQKSHKTIYKQKIPDLLIRRNNLQSHKFIHQLVSVLRICVNFQLLARFTLFQYLHLLDDSNDYGGVQCE